MTTTENVASVVIIVTPDARAGVTWPSGFQWKIVINTDPDYANDEFDEPIELIDPATDKSMGLYPENAEALGHALLRAARVRRDAVERHTVWVKL